MRNCGVRRGASLIELMMVLGIVSVIAAIAMPRFGASTDRYRTELAAKRIAADLIHARTRAESRSASHEIVFSLANDDYVVTAMPDPDHPAEDYRVMLTDEPYHATLVSADFDGDSIVTFDGFGVPDSGGTVVVQAGGVQRTVTIVANTGQVTVP